MDISDLIIKAGAVLSALAVIIGAFTAMVRLIEKNKKEVERNERQDADIAAIKKRNLYRYQQQHFSWRRFPVS